MKNGNPSPAKSAESAELLPSPNNADFADNAGGLPSILEGLPPGAPALLPSTFPSGLRWQAFRLALRLRHQARESGKVDNSQEK